MPRDKSFPAILRYDAAYFSAFMWRYFGKVAGLSPLLFCGFAFQSNDWRTLVTDIILVGSMTVILIGLPRVLLTPLVIDVITFFDKSLHGKNKHFQNK